MVVQGMDALPFDPNQDRGRGRYQSAAIFTQVLPTRLSVRFRGQTAGNWAVPAWPEVERSGHTAKIPQNPKFYLDKTSTILIV